MARSRTHESFLVRHVPSWLRLDTIAGLSVAALLIPESMGFAGIAGLPPQVGLYAGRLSVIVIFALWHSAHPLKLAPVLRSRGKSSRLPSSCSSPFWLSARCRRSSLA